MELDVLRSLWGLVDDYAAPSGATEPLPGIAAAGYAGVVAPAAVIGDLGGFVTDAEARGLSFVPQVFSWGRTVDEHIDSFRRSLEQVVPFAPRFAIAQAGRDSFTDDEAVRFYRAALQIEADLGVTVAFETHRTRILFTPWRTMAMLERFNTLKLNCDLSHWVCVTERLKLHPDIIAACAERAVHLDARVGHVAGAQVADPRAPEYADELEAHLGWWDAIWDGQERQGVDTTSLMPEFGPPPYQTILPFGGGPVGDLGEINDWMADLLRRRFDGRTATDRG